MTLGKNIQKARKSLQITQEQLAQQLGISGAAVSKWENDATYPDIFLLPPLARILCLSMDELFAFQKNMQKEEALAFGKRILENFQSMEFEQAYTILQKSVREYPNDISLSYTIGSNLWKVLPNLKEEKEIKTLLDISEQLLLKVIDKGNQEEHDLACASLSTIYLMNDKMQEALHIVDEIYEATLDPKLLKAGIYLNLADYERCLPLYEESELKAITSIRMSTLGLISVYIKKHDYVKVIQLCRQNIALFELYEIHVFMPNEYESMAQCFIEMKDMANAQDALIHCLHSLLVEPSYSLFSNCTKMKPMEFPTRKTILVNYLVQLQTKSVFHTLLQCDEVKEVMSAVEKELDTLA